MIDWRPSLPTLAARRWQSRAEILKAHLNSLSPEELRHVRPHYYWLRFGHEAWKRRQRLKANFNPNQPRVPAGNPDGGQWTSDEIGITSRVRFADASNVLGSPVMSDANPDPIIPGAQYAQTLITIYPSALTGLSTIDNTTRKLTETLATVVDVVGPLGTLTPRAYGTIVHVAFANAVRLQRLPGISFSDVETLFGGSRYGKGGVRTDVVLRNDVGDVIAIYDVKTGDSGIEPARAAQLRAKVGVGSKVPIIEINLMHGVQRKGWVSRTRWMVGTASVLIQVRRS
jgi:hypothetical protein